jgi:hypothetical protein
MKKYASKKTHKGKTAYRTPSRFIYKKSKKQTQCYKNTGAKHQN